MGTEMTSMQRVLTTLGHEEPDRVPHFLLVTMHGARELGLSIEEYFSRAENVIEGQLRMRERFRHDCLYTFFYASIEIEAMGGKVLFRDDGPANAGAPFIKTFGDIEKLENTDMLEASCLKKVLKTTEGLKAEVGDEVPIIGVVMSPFSLPVMQMGFESYLDLIYDDPALFERLIKVNEEFCVEWANAQLEAGATAICYFDPISSPTVFPREMYLKKGFEIARRTIARINGPTATHMASGRSIPILDDIAKTGTAVVGVSALEDMSEIKDMCRDKLTVLGNLNGIEMRRWTPEDAEMVVKEAIAKAGRGGGFILSDNHGEIPWQVPEDVLMAISDAVRKWGRYPLDWVDEYGK